MLKITRLKSASRSGDYYGKDDYYVTGEANKPGLVWGGEGADALGLEGLTDPKDFKKLLQGINPDASGPAISKLDEALRKAATGEGEGEKPPAIPKHAPGWDMTFSAPKSFSIMALVAGDDRLQDLHNRSVQRAMDYAEKHFSVTRTRDGAGGVRESITGNLVYATTEHGMSRAGDPTMHNHVVVMNTTQTEAGKWQALETRHLYKHMNLLGQIYQAELQMGARELGYNVVQGKTAGTWEIAEFAPGRPSQSLDSSVGPASQLIETFSQRHTLITERLEAETLTKGRDLTPAERQAVILRDRPNKLGSPRAEVQATWRAIAEKEGVDLKAIEQGSLERTTGQNLTAQRIGKIGLMTRLSGFVDEKVFGRLRDVTADFSLKVGLRNQEQRSTVFTPHAVIADAMKYNGNLHRIDTYLESGFFQRAEIRKADKTRLEAITTQRAVDLENSLVERIVKAPARSAAFDRAEIDATLYAIVSDRQTIAPNADQAKVVNQVLSDGARYSLIHGSAGTGKTTTFDLLRQSLTRLSDNCIEMVAIAPTHMAKAEMASRGGMSAETVQMFLIRHEAGPATPGPNLKPPQDLKGKWLLVDEASMLSNDELRRVADVADKAGIDKVILSFDERQLAALEAGAPARLVMHKGASTVYLKDNVRQKGMPDLRDGIMKMADGKTFDALPKMLPYIIETKTAADQAIAEAAVKKWQDMGADTRLIVATNKMRGLVSGMVRSRLQEAGVVGTENVSQSVYISEGRSKTELGMITTYALGQTLVFHRADPRNGIGKDTVHEVVGIDRRYNRLELQSDAYGTRSVSLKALTAGGDEPRFGVYRKLDIELSVGDRMAWNITDQKKGITNNAEFTISAIHGRQIAIEQVGDAGAENSPLKRVIDLDRDHVAHFMSHAYAITANRAQGQSYDKAIAVMGSNMGEFANHARGYVMSSRPKEDFVWVTNDVKALFRQMAANDGINPSALDNIDEAFDRSLAEKKEPQKDKEIRTPEPDVTDADRKDQGKPIEAWSSAEDNAEKAEAELKLEKQITQPEITFLS